MKAKLELIARMKELAKELAREYDSNLKIELNVNTKDDIVRIKDDFKRIK